MRTTRTNALILSFRTLAVLTAVAAAGCTSPDDDPATKAQPGTVAPTAAPTAAPAPAAAVLPGNGKVLETMNSGGYTYVRVDMGGSELWAAGPQTEVKVGEIVSIPVGIPMQEFRSESLNRVFPLVYFVAAIQTTAVRAADAMNTAHKPVAAPAATVAAPVARLEGGQSVEEIVTKRADFAGKDVAVRGRVVKFNSGIMGSNWIHIQDGTGAPGTNDLTVTTDAKAAVGDIVVVRGKVTTDKDFGAGYKYAVIVEKAAVETVAAEK